MKDRSTPFFSRRPLGSRGPDLPPAHVERSGKEKKKKKKKKRVFL